MKENKPLSEHIGQYYTSYFNFLKKDCAGKIRRALFTYQDQGNESMETEYTLPDGDKFYLDEPILNAGRQLFAESRADSVNFF